jgi:glucoamylase
MLQTMAGAANVGYQISEQVWDGSTGVNGFTFGQPDNSSTPLMWAMAQYVRLAIDISAGTDVDTPSVVSSCLLHSSCPVTAPVQETVNVTVPVSTTPRATPCTWTGTCPHSASASRTGRRTASR